MKLATFKTLLNQRSYHETLYCLVETLEQQNKVQPNFQLEEGISQKAQVCKIAPTLSLLHCLHAYSLEY